MKNNIVLIIDSLAGGGAEKINLRLAEMFIEKDFNVTIIIIKNIIEHKINENIKIISLNYKKNGLPKIIRDFFYSHKLNQILNSIPNKKLIIGSLALSNKLMNCIDSKHKFHYALHNTMTIAKFGQKNLLNKYLKKRELIRIYENKRIICVSDGVKEDILSLKIKPKSIEVIYNPFDFNEIRNKANEKIEFQFPENNYLIHVGRFAKVKRHDILIKAFSKIKNKEIKLILVGQGEEKDNIKQLISELNLEKRIIFTNFQKNPFPIIKKAKALILSSDREGLPTVLIEALILNTPIVSTNCPSGPNEIMKSSLQRFLTKVGDYNDLADKINLILSTELTIDENLIQKFNMNEIIKQYMKIIGDN
ncbi:glycosyltransferase [Aliarcobacter butzleri]|uniref:glycosyltransferase n=1 Tax=Aliarcobacter butzleri TaxID=28197 RepID=UPI0012608569|nr:glycosyltransferase [Aliarcobacter butzleri]